MSLRVEAERVAAEAKQERREQRRDERKVCTEKLRAGFVYAFGEEAAQVEYDTDVRRFVATSTDGLRFTTAHDSSIETWQPLVVCPDCGVEYVHRQSLGALKNEYGPSREKTADERRADAVARLARVFDGSAYNGHRCYQTEVRDLAGRVRSTALAVKLSPYEVLSRVEQRLAETGA